MQKIAVLGAGRVGYAIIHDLRNNYSISAFDVDEKVSGTGSLAHHVGDGQGSHGCIPSSVPRGGDIFDGGETYMRWWMKLDADFVWGSNQQKQRRRG